jgi:hypothetical protein
MIKYLIYSITFCVQSVSSKFLTCSLKNADIPRFYDFLLLNCNLSADLEIHPYDDATAQIGPWPPVLRFHNNNVLRCVVVSLTTDPR